MATLNASFCAIEYLLARNWAYTKIRQTLLLILNMIGLHKVLTLWNPHRSLGINIVPAKLFYRSIFTVIQKCEDSSVCWLWKGDKTQKFMSMEQETIGTFWWSSDIRSSTLLLQFSKNYAGMQFNYRQEP